MSPSHAEARIKTFKTATCVLWLFYCSLTAVSYISCGFWHLLNSFQCVISGAFWIVTENGSSSGLPDFSLATKRLRISLSGHGITAPNNRWNDLIFYSINMSWVRRWKAARDKAAGRWVCLKRLFGGDRSGAENDVAQHNTHVLVKYTQHILTRVFRLYLRLCLTTTLSMEHMFDQVTGLHSCGVCQFIAVVFGHLFQSRYMFFSFSNICHIPSHSLYYTI